MARIDDDILRLPPQQQYFMDFAADAYQRASVTLPVGWSLEAALKPEFWVHLVHRFKADQMSGGKDRAGAIIEVRTEDHAFYAELYVRAVQDRGLIVDIMTGPHYFGSKGVVETKGYETRWNVGKRSFDIIRKSDREIVAAAKTKELAADWIAKTAGQTVAEAAA